MLVPVPSPAAVAVQNSNANVADKFITRALMKKGSRLVFWAIQAIAGATAAPLTREPIQLKCSDPTREGVHKSGLVIPGRHHQGAGQESVTIIWRS